MSFDPKKSSFLILNKKKGFSSNGELNYLKRLLKIKKAGFCGTLDPLAQGVLVVAIEKATKLISLATDFDKVYSGKIRLGFTSVSLDLGTELVSSGTVPQNIDCAEIEKRFQGVISQIPPAYSALKIDGKRAYKLAREGKTPEMKARNVEIKSLGITRTGEDELSFLVKCSKGTYIRTLAGDIGEFLGCGAVLTELIRREVGPFKLENAVSIDELKENPENIEKALLSVPEFLSGSNSCEVDESGFNYLKNGNKIEELGLNLENGLNLIKFNGEVFLIVEKTEEKASYFAFV